MAASYDTIGTTYAKKRLADQRIAMSIQGVLHGCTSILNVGAGTGSYEPRHCAVIAVEPSRTMVMQRPSDAAPVVQARAEALPFADQGFDAVLAILTVHHWTDKTKGVSECARVARNRVVFLTDPEALAGFWLFEYFPSLWAIDKPIFPKIMQFAQMFRSIEVTPVLIPADCRDGFLGAYWRRPEAYLDPLVRSSISTFSKISADDTNLGLLRLQTAIASGAWAARHAGIKDRDTLDVGYRLVIGRSY